MRIDKHFLYYKFPPVIYALLILSVSTLSFATPPQLGVVWQDKIYHCAEYFVFGILVFRAFPEITPAKRKKLYLFLILMGLLFAGIDEIVQSFIPRRDSSVWDMLADHVGYLLAAFLYIIVRHRHRTNSH